jgi:hypothetical protein
LAEKHSFAGLQIFADEKIRVDVAWRLIRPILLATTFLSTIGTDAHLRIASNWHAQRCRHGSANCGY